MENEVLFSLHIEELPEGCFLGTSEDIPGLVAQGRTIAETIEIAKDVARKLIESYREHGEEVPFSVDNTIHGTIDLKIPIGI